MKCFWTAYSLKMEGLPPDVAERVRAFLPSWSAQVRTAARVWRERWAMHPAGFYDGGETLPRPPSPHTPPGFAQRSPPSSPELGG